MQDLWGKPNKGKMKKGRAAVGIAEKGFWGSKAGGGGPSPFSNGNVLRDMKTNTLSENKGASAKVFKSMGF